MSRNRDQYHSHCNITEMTRQSDCRESVPFILDTAFKATMEEVLIQPRPPCSGDDSIECDEPQGHASCADCWTSLDDWELPVGYLLRECLLQLGMKGSHGEKSHGDGQPEVPDDNVEASLERKQPLPTGTGIAVMFGSEGKPQREAECGQ